MRATAWAAAWAAVAALAAGCGGGEKTPGPGANRPGGQPTGAPKLPTGELKDGTAADLDAFLKDNKSFVVLYEFWSVGDPGAADRVAKVDKHYLENLGYGLRTAAVCVDDPGKRAEAEKLLKDKDVRAANFFLTDKAAPGLAEKYGFAGQTPHQVVFARSGDRVWKTGDPLPQVTGPGGKAEASPERKFQVLVFQELDKTK
ncbi:MAG: hypothetical protein K2X87_17615 [Gemmataceae bacterium]|nr:hypothetical protein [Gemmataceae bacterium]